MSDEEVASDMDTLVTDALSDMFQHKKGALLNRFVLVAEVIDSSGSESLWLANSPGMAPWTMMGYLDYGKLIASSAVTKANDDD